MRGIDGAPFDGRATEAAQPAGRSDSSHPHIPIRRVFLIRDVWIEHDFAQWLESFRVSFNHRSKVWTLEDLWINDRVPNRSTVRLDSAEAVVWAIVENLAEQEAGLGGGLAAVEVVPASPDANVELRRLVDLLAATLAGYVATDEEDEDEEDDEVDDAKSEATESEAEDDRNST